MKGSYSPLYIVNESWHFVSLLTVVPCVVLICVRTSTGSFLVSCGTSVKILASKQSASLLFA